MGARGALVAAALAAAALSGCGGGDEQEPSTLPAAPDMIELTTPAFKDGGAIPKANTCDGAGTPPTIAWRGASPADGAELVLVVEDPDAPDGSFIHWTAYNMTTATGSGLAPDGQFPTGTKYGKNSAGKEGWAPPCPPEGDDAHRYVFSMYELKEASGLEAGADPATVLAKLEGAVGRGTFTGTYQRAN